MTRPAFRIAAILALVSTTQLLAAPVAKPCMSQAELRGLIAYVLPAAMTTVLDRCKAALPAQSSLLTRGAQLASELQGGRTAVFPLARQAFTKFSDAGDASTTAVMLAMPESAMQPIIDETVSKELATSIKPKDCPDIDRVFATLEPLPANNFVDLFTQALIIFGRDDKQMPICAA